MIKIYRRHRTTKWYISLNTPVFYFKSHEKLRDLKFATKTELRKSSNILSFNIIETEIKFFLCISFIYLEFNLFNIKPYFYDINVFIYYEPAFKLYILHF